MQDLSLVPQNLNVALNAISPLNTIVNLGKLYNECALILDDQKLHAYLIVLSMREFGVILGID